MPSVRTFIAFDTPSPIKNEMRQLQEELKKSHADVKWESIDKFHATIKFLGNVEESMLQQVISITESILRNISKFDVSFQSLGCFPNKKHPRVIWIGSENNDGKLQGIKDMLDKALVSYGFEIEDRAFHPHITLGRVKGLRGLNNLTPMLENLTFEPHKASINEILIMKSTLKPEGSIYSVLKSFKLKH